MWICENRYQFQNVYTSCSQVFLTIFLKCQISFFLNLFLMSQFSFLFFWQYWDLNLGLVLARQVIYYFSHSHSPFLIYFSERPRFFCFVWFGFFCWGQASGYHLPTYASWEAGCTTACHAGLFIEVNKPPPALSLNCCPPELHLLSTWD
jgi:hypothetical protein